MLVKIPKGINLTRGKTYLGLQFQRCQPMVTGLYCLLSPNGDQEAKENKTEISGSQQSFQGHHTPPQWPQCFLIGHDP